MKKFALVSFVSLLMTGVATAQDISTEQPGDRQLSCNKLAAEIVKMDRIISDTEESIQTKQNVREGGNMAAQAGASSIPFLGSIMGMASRVASSSESKQRRLLMQAKSRKSNVTRYFNQKGCSARSYEKAKLKAVNEDSQAESSGSGFFGGLFGSHKRMAISTAKLNIRKGPSAKKPVVGQLASGEKVKVKTTRNGWMQISTPNVNGWVSEKYMRKVN